MYNSQGNREENGIIKILCEYKRKLKLRNKVFEKTLEE